MVNRIKYTPIADIVDYFKNVHKISGPIECTSMVTRIAINLGCPEMANLAYIEGMYLILVLTILFTLYLCCMVIRLSSYLTRAFDYTLLKVLHYSLIGWESRTTASQDHLALTAELTWRQHSRP
jgi:cytochrome b561